LGSFKDFLCKGLLALRFFSAFLTFLGALSFLWLVVEGLPGPLCFKGFLTLKK